MISTSFLVRCLIRPGSDPADLYQVEHVQSEEQFRTAVWEEVRAWMEIRIARVRAGEPPKESGDE